MTLVQARATCCGYLPPPRTDLEVYCHSGLPRFHRERGFIHRPDEAYLTLATECPYLHTIMIRERVSSSTILLLAFTAKNLRYFYVRKNAIILKCDWKQKEVGATWK